MANQALLQQLRDIHVPDPIGFWPLAPAWWVMLTAFFLILLLALYLRQGLRLTS